MIDNEGLEKANGDGRVSRSVLITGKGVFVEYNSRAYNDSELHGNAHLMDGSKLYDFSKIMGNSHVVASVLQGFSMVLGNSFVSDTLMFGTSMIMDDAVVTNSLLRDSAKVFDNAIVEKSILTSNVRVGGKAFIRNVHTENFELGESAVIFGDAVLDFDFPMDILPGTRVHEGTWKRPPIVYTLEDFPTMPIVESVGDRVLIGCLSHSINFWYKRGPEVVANYGMPEESFFRFKVLVEKIEQAKKINPSPKNTRKRNAV